MDKQCSHDILFPFGKVPQGKSILIYGAGKVGHIYLEQIRRTNFCLVKGFIDKNKQKLGENIAIYGINDINNIEFDYIVIAVKDHHQQSLIEESLLLNGVNGDKIIRYDDSVYFTYSDSIIMDDGGKLAFQMDAVSIAIRLGDGIGDSIVTKKFWETLAQMSSRFKVDIFTRHKKSDVMAIYRDEEFVNKIIEDADDICEKNKYYYQVVVSHGNFPDIEWLAPKQKWGKQDYLMYEMFKNIISYREKYKSADNITPFMHYHKQIYLKNNFYSSLSCEGLIPIKGHKVHIPFDCIGKDEFEKLKLKKYITLNYGNGTSMEQADKINKQWPYRHFSKFVNIFKKKYPQIDIVQIGAVNACKIDNVDLLLLGKSLETIKHVLHGAIFHLDIEGGLVHLATQLGTKCLVLFGPTLEEFYAYPENINISAGNCRGCWELYGMDRLCAKRLPYPECMELITPEKVMESVDEYFGDKSF